MLVTGLVTSRLYWQQRDLYWNRKKRERVGGGGGGPTGSVLEVEKRKWAKLSHNTVKGSAVDRG